MGCTFTATTAFRAGRRANIAEDPRKFHFLLCDLANRWPPDDCRIHLINPLLKRKKSSLESVETLQLRLHLRPVSTYFSFIVISEETPPWPPPGGRLCSVQEIDPSIAVLINASRQRGLGKTCYFLIFFFSREFSLPSAAAELICFSNYQKSRPLYCFGRLRSLSCRLVAATSVILLLLGCPPSTPPPPRLRF